MRGVLGEEAREYTTALNCDMLPPLLRENACALHIGTARRTWDPKGMVVSPPTEDLVKEVAVCRIGDTLVRRLGGQEVTIEGGHMGLEAMWKLGSDQSEGKIGYSFPSGVEVRSATSLRFFEPEPIFNYLPGRGRVIGNGKGTCLGYSIAPGFGCISTYEAGDTWLRFEEPNGDGGQ